MATNSDKLRQRVTRIYGKGYYDLLIRTGLAAGIPKATLAKELGTSIGNIEKLIKTYGEEIRDLKITARVCSAVFEEMQRVKLSAMMMTLTDQVMGEIEDPESEMGVRDKIDFLKFVTKHLSAREDRRIEREGERAPEIPKEEFQERAERLLQEGNLKLVKTNS